MARPKYTPEQRIEKYWERVDKSGGDDACWIWTAANTPLGYGKLRWNDSFEYAHRVSWAFAYGPIPDGMHILHECDNPACVNPNHLKLGTHQDNMGDRDKKGRVNAKLTRQKVERIRLMYKSGGYSQRELARKFKVTGAQVCRIVNGASWKA